MLDILYVQRSFVIRLTISQHTLHAKYYHVETIDTNVAIDIEAVPNLVRYPGPCAIEFASTEYRQ